MSRFMPGAALHAVPGVGTFSVFSVASGFGSEGLQMQFMPEGGSEPLSGVLRFGVRLLDDGSPEIAYLDPVRHPTWGNPILLIADEKVIAAGQILAEDVLGKDDTFAFFTMETAVRREIREIETRRTAASTRASGWRATFEREQAAASAGGNEPPSVSAQDVERREREKREIFEGSEVRLSQITHLLVTLREWSGRPRSERQGLRDFLSAHREEASVGPRI